MVLDDICASEYLNQLLQDKTTVSKMPKIFLHSERLLDEGMRNVVYKYDLCLCNSLLFIVKCFSYL